MIDIRGPELESMQCKMPESERHILTIDDLAAGFRRAGLYAGQVAVRVMRQRVVVDFAVRWMEANRPASLQRSGS